MYDYSVKLKQDLEAYKASHADMSQKFVQAMAQVKYFREELEKANDDFKKLQGHIRKAAQEAENYYAWCVMFTTGEMTLEKLKELLSKDRGPTFRNLRGK